MPISLLQAREEYIHYSVVTFRRLLDSLARPGKLNQLVYPTFLKLAPDFSLSSSAEPISPNFYALAALATLVDGETNFVIAAHGHWLDQNAPAVRWLALRSGSTAVAAHIADFAFFCGGSSQGLLRELNPGSLLEPELSATAIYCVEYLEAAEYKEESSLRQPQRADLWHEGSRHDPSKDVAITLELRGPGIQEWRSIKVIGLDRDEIELIMATRRNFPLGIDVYLVDSAGRCVGLPRTTKLHVRDHLIPAKGEG